MKEIRILNDFEKTNWNFSFATKFATKQSIYISIVDIVWYTSRIPLNMTYRAKRNNSAIRFSAKSFCKCKTANPLHRLFKVKSSFKPIESSSIVSFPHFEWKNISQVNVSLIIAVHCEAIATIAEGLIR